MALASVVCGVHRALKGQIPGARAGGRRIQSWGGEGLADSERHQLHLIAEILRRDLEVLAGELVATSEADLWRSARGVTNSVGTLSLHMCGNLMHFVGSLLGGTDYVRDREAEFGDRGLERDDLLRRVEETRTMLASVLPGLPEGILLRTMPGVPPRFQGCSVAFFLAHLSSHLAYHLGQVNYLRRILAAGSELE